jgi:hypothetical protein
MHAATVLLAIALGLAVSLRTASAHANGLDASICETFSVRHSTNPREDNSKNVTVELLLDDGTVTKCFNPQQDYWVRLRANAHISGFLLQAVTGARLPSTNRKDTVPFDTTWGPCENSMSHTQIRVAASKDLVFPLTTRKSPRPILFRYSVVFSPTSFQQDRYVEIPCCELTQAETTTNGLSSGNGPSDDGSSDDSPSEQSTESPLITTLPPLGILVEEGNCGKTVVNIKKTFNDTHNGIRYNCTINKPLKQTECVESCDLNGQPVVCQIYKAIKRRKGYTCVLYRDGDQQNMDNTVSTSRSTIYNETVTTGCQCYTPESTETSAL